jgi:hypothetical protein
MVLVRGSTDGAAGCTGSASATASSGGNDEAKPKQDQRCQEERFQRSPKHMGFVMQG